MLILNTLFFHTLIAVTWAILNFTKPEYNTSGIEVFHPCPDKDQLVLTRRIKGTNSELEENYFNGQLNFNSWFEISRVIIAITLDNDATIKVNPQDARVVSEGNTFWIQYYKAPPQRRNYHFQIQSAIGSQIPNIERFTLNYGDFCNNLQKWNPTFYPQLFKQKNVTKVEDYSCGKKDYKRDNLLYHNAEISKEDWPWHVAIFHITNLDIQYKCGGSLISSNSVLTAAHCVVENDHPIIPDRVYVSINSLKITSAHTNYKAFRIIPHNKFDSASLKNDIAIINLDAQVKFDKDIRPICLWSEDSVDIGTIVNKTGFGVAYRVNNITGELTLRQINFKIPSSTKCVQNNSDFFINYVNDYTFCAGGESNQPTVCSGDSGSGVYFNESNTFRIRGIISLISTENGDCNNHDYAILTDVAKYLNWIKENLI